MNNQTWIPISDAPTDGTTIVLFTTCHGICEAWFYQGKWSDDTPISPAEYEGSVWVCCDDAFQIEVEEGVGPNGENYNGTATHWVPKPLDPVTA